MASEFERKDFISDDGFAAPLILAKRWEEYLRVMKEVRAAGLGAVATPKSGGDSSTSTKKLKEETVKLTNEQKELIKVQNALAVAVAKDNDLYRKQEQALVKLKAEIKAKNALGEKEALQVNKLNSSLTELEAALNTNRVAYASLRSEQDRTSKNGLILLKTIQQQKESVSSLREEMGQFSGNVGNYTGSILKAHAAIKLEEEETKKLILAQRLLDKSTDEGKQAHDTLSNSILANVTKINAYRKEAGMASTSQKELNKELEESEKKSSGLGDALGEISPGLKSAYDGAVSFGKALWALVANPVGVILVAIAAAVAGLARYFTASSEGQDKWNKVLAVGSALLDQFLDVLEGVGKALVNMWEEPKKAWKSFMAFLDPVITIFKDLGQGIADIFMFKGTGNLKKALGEIKTLAKDVWVGAKEAADDYYKESQRRAAIALKITDEEAKLRKDLIQDIIDDSKTELKASKDLQIVHDHLRNTDEDRLAAIRDANQLLEDQAKGDIALAQEEQKTFEDKLALEKLSLDTTMMEGAERRKLIDDAIAGGKIDYDNRQKVAELIVKINKTEQDFLDGQKRRLSEEFTLVSEISARKLAQIKAEKEAQANLNKWRLEDTIATNEKILEDELADAGQQTLAIIEINDAKIQLAQDAADKEKEISLAAAKDRVNLSAEERKEIYGNKLLSIQDQINLEDKYRTAKASKDQAYITDTTKISAALYAEIEKLNDEATKKAEENVFTVLARDAAKAQSTIDETFARAMIDAEKQFADTGNLKDYYSSKQQLQDNAQRISLESQLAYLKKQASQLEDGSAAKADIDAKIAQTELDLIQNNNALKLQYEQELETTMQQLKQVAVDTALTVIDNYFAAEDEKRQARLEHIQDTMNQELAAAGDNESAKLAIKNKAEQEQQKIRLQQAAADRKRAIFEKTIAVVSIAVNTAKGIGQALGTYPPPASFVLAALTGVIGALQIAAVLSKPIPSYAVGTENHAGGIARVGEEGTELVTLPGGKQFLTPDGETYMDLPSGSKVDTHKDTMNKLALASLPHTDSRGDRRDLEGFDALGKKIDANTQAIKNKKEQHWNISKQGMQAMVKNAETRQYFMDQLYR